MESDTNNKELCGILKWHVRYHGLYDISTGAIQCMVSYLAIIRIMYREKITTLHTKEPHWLEK